jgi:hypothetical protein
VETYVISKSKYEREYEFWVSFQATKKLFAKEEFWFIYEFLFNEISLQVLEDLYFVPEFLEYRETSQHYPYL